MLAGEQKVKEGCSQVVHSSGLVSQHVCVHSEDQSSAGFSQDSSTVWSEDELKYEVLYIVCYLRKYTVCYIIYMPCTYVYTVLTYIGMVLM